jgi:hypothetical protein
MYLSFKSVFPWFFWEWYYFGPKYWLFAFFPRGLIEGTVTARVLSSRKRREEDRIGQSQPFLEQTFSG